MQPGSRTRPGLALLLVLLAPGATLSAQRLGSISGTVRAAQRGPFIEGARVVLLGTTFTTPTNSRGEFTFHGLTPGKYVIQASAIGFATLSAEVEVKSLEVLEVEFETDPEVARLPDVGVEERSNLPMDFARRKANGLGRYYTRAEIERRDARTFPDLLRTVPGFRIECSRYPCRVQVSRCPRGTQPAYFIDGVPAEADMALLMSTRDLEGVEVYSGPAETPPELERRTACGTIVLWTRRPPPAIRKDKKPKAPPDTAKAPPAKPDTVPRYF